MPWIARYAILSKTKFLTNIINRKVLVMPIYMIKTYNLHVVFDFVKNIRETQLPLALQLQ